MDDKLKRYLQYIPAVGDAYNFQHDCATAISKNRTSAVIQRTNGGVYWKCFRCGENGRLGKKVYYKSFYTDMATQETRTRELPKDLRSITDEDLGCKWLKEAGLTDQEIEQREFKWSPRVQRVFYPCRGRDNSIGAWQARAIHPEDLKRRKYDTYWGSSSRTTHCFVRSANPEISNTLIITEDYLSAIRCARYADSLALGTTSLKKEILLPIISDYTIILLGLDNDAGGHKGARKLLNMLRPYRTVKDLKLEKDPKTLSHEELGVCLLSKK